MNYTSFLQLLLALASNLTFVLSQLRIAVDAVKAIADKIRPAADGGELQFTATTPEEEALEGQVAMSLTASGSQALFDPSVLRTIWAAAQKYPIIMQIIIALLKGG